MKLWNELCNKYIEILLKHTFFPLNHQLILILVGCYTFIRNPVLSLYGKNMS